MSLIKFLLKHALLFYVTYGLLVATLMGLATGVVDQYRLVGEGAQVTGVVIEPDCGRHMSIVYRFDVAGAKYSGRSVSDYCSTVVAGAGVNVHYLPADPSVNTAGDPGLLFRSNRDTILLAAVTSPAFVLLIFRARLKNGKRAAGRRELVMTQRRQGDHIRRK
jgi:hypothetical protein